MCFQNRHRIDILILKGRNRKEEGIIGLKQAQNLARQFALHLDALPSHLPGVVASPPQFSGVPTPMRLHWVVVSLFEAEVEAVLTLGLCILGL